MKKITRLTFILLLAAITLFALSACSEKPAEIVIKDADMPLTRFIQGHDIDLSSGKLTVIYKNREETIALDDTDIKVSGHDKDLLGEQEITLTYKKVKVKLIINVVARIVASEINADYFVGESFDRSKGSVTVNMDDGQSQDILLSNNMLILENFNSSAPGTVTVRCSVADTEYTGSFDVIIHKIDSIEFTAPTKLDYQSHESLSVAGGKFKFNSDGGFSREFVLEQSMVSGYEPDLAGMAHRINPLKQTLSAVCLAQTKNFDINIKFSDVSLIKMRAKEFAELNWSSTVVPAVTITQGTAALEAFDLYVNLPQNQKSIVQDEQINYIVRTAAAYGCRLFDETLEIADNYSEKSGYQSSKALYLQLKDDKIYEDTAPFEIIIAEFGEVNLIGGTPIAYYLADVKRVVEFSKMLRFMIELYEPFIGVPSNLGVGDRITDDAALLAYRAKFDPYKEKISNAYTLIVSGGFRDNRLPFEIVASWREEAVSKDDFFEIIYLYYYFMANSTATSALRSIYLPGIFEELYRTIGKAFVQINGLNSVLINDTTDFMLDYDHALEIQRGIFSGDQYRADNFMYRNLFASSAFTFSFSNSSGNFNTLIQRLRIGKSDERYSFNYNHGAMLNEPVFTALWEDYLDTVKGGGDIEKVFKNFVELSPAHQHAFIVSLSPHYLAHRLPEYAFDANQSFTTVFVDMLYRHYSGVLTSNAFNVFKSLAVTLEKYTLYRMNFVNEKNDIYNLPGYYYDQYLINMSQAMALYSALDGDDKKSFDDNLEYFYLKYDNIYQIVTAPELTDDDMQAIGDWEQILIDILANLVRHEESLVMILNPLFPMPEYSAFFSAFGAAEYLAKRILEEAPPEVIDIYLHKPLPGMAITTEVFLHLHRSYNTAFLTDPQLALSSTVLLSDFFRAATLNPFLFEANTVIGKSLEPGHIFSPDDKDMIQKAMAAFRAMPLHDQYVFLFLIEYEEHTNWYLTSIINFCNAVLPEEAIGAAELLFNFERLYVSLVGEYTSDDIAELLSFWGEVEDSLIKISTDDRALFIEYLGPMYNYYLAVYNTLSIFG